MVAPEVLAKLKCFKWAGQDSLKTLAMVSNEVSFSPGQELFREGEPANFMYVLTEGEVEIQYALSSGQRRTVDTLAAGDLVLWSAVVAPYITTAYGVAPSGCSAVAIDGDRLRQLINEDGELHNSLMLEIVKVTAHRLKGARAQLAQLR